MEILSKDQNVFDEDGNATAVIIPIEKYKDLLLALKKLRTGRKQNYFLNYLSFKN